MLKLDTNKKGKFYPSYIAESVSKINFLYLKNIGVKAVFIDLDGTVVFRKKHEVPTDIIQALKNQPLDIYIATNRSKDIKHKYIASQLNAKNIINPDGIWLKPTKNYYRNALKNFNLEKNEVVMVGDRYFQDIFGANNSGIRSLLINKLDIPDNVIDKYLSKFEKNHTNKILKYYSNIDKYYN